MNIGINLDHQVNTSQQLNLAPQLLQWLRLLQLPTTELTAIVQTELEKNPALELDSSNVDGNEAPVEDSANPDSLEAETTVPLSSPDTKDTDKEKYELLAEINEQWNLDTTHSPGRNSQDSDTEEKQRYIIDSITSTPSLHEHLLKQLPRTGMSQQNINIAELIIGSIDEKGYLSLPIENIASATGSETKQVEKILAMIQSFDPVGVAARDLRECLLLQLQSCDETSLARKIVGEHLELLARKQHTEIARILDVDVDDIMEAQQIIISLNPAPGSKFSEKAPEYVNADVIVHNIDGTYVTELNDTHIPRLRISASCQQLINKPGLKPDESSYLRNKIRSASFLIQGIRQRQATLQKVAEQVVSLQQDYLSNPTGEMKPLTMAKVAAIIGVHETTVSRAISSKYIRTPRGLFEMKHFFRAGYRCADGSAMTPETVKNMISELIEKENPVSPLKDITIARILEKKDGLRLARRTIAKYREEISIPSSKERRRQTIVSTAAHKAKRDSELNEKHDIGMNTRKPEVPFASESIQSAVA